MASSDPNDPNDPIAANVPLPSPLLPRMSMRSLVIAVTAGAIIFAMLRAGGGWTPVVRGVITMVTFPAAILFGCVTLFLVQWTVASIWYVGGEPPVEPEDDGPPPRNYPPRNHPNGDPVT